MKVKAVLIIPDIYKMSSMGVVLGCIVKWGRIDAGDSICIMDGSKKVFPVEEDYYYVEHLKRFRENVPFAEAGDEVALAIGGVTGIVEEFTVLVFGEEKEKEDKVGAEYIYRKASSN